MTLRFLHLHRFDPAKWELFLEPKIFGRKYRDLQQITRTYRNTCTECGDIVFRKVVL